MGADDPIVPPVNGRIVASRLRRATLETVDCGHLFVLTRPGETARRVECFMAQHAFCLALTHSIEGANSMSYRAPSRTCCSA